MLKNKIKYGTSLNNVPEYKVYMGMKARCYNPNNDAYHNYGGRGIKVCDRWPIPLKCWSIPLPTS